MGHWIKPLTPSFLLKIIHTCRLTDRQTDRQTKQLTLSVNGAPIYVTNYVTLRFVPMFLNTRFLFEYDVIFIDSS